MHFFFCRWYCYVMLWKTWKQTYKRMNNYLSWINDWLLEKQLSLKIGKTTYIVFQIIQLLTISIVCPLKFMTKKWRNWFKYEMEETYREKRFEKYNMFQKGWDIYYLFLQNYSNVWAQTPYYLYINCSTA